MGFQAPVTKYRLKFEDAALAGLEVEVRSVPIGTFLELTALMSTEDAPVGERMTGTFRLLAAALVSWNIEDAEGKSVPATFDGVKGLETGFVMKIVGGWMAAMSGPSEDSDLGKGSGSTPPSDLALSLPMEPLSPSRGN